ncbi:MAG: TetR/AcrR family transcriptional regulator [Kofleriaceae bacterium]
MRPSRHEMPAHAFADKRGYREAILRAAAQEFALRGFDGATTVAIAERAGVTQPLIHHHYGSKAKLWSSVLADLFGALTSAIAEANKPVLGEKLRDRIQRLLRTTILFGAERPELSRLIRLESASGGSSFEQLYTVYLAPLIRFFEATFTAAEGAGLIRPLDRGFVYFAVMGAGMQLFTEPVTARRAFGIDTRAPDVAHAYADFVIDVMLGSVWEKGR